MKKLFIVVAILATLGLFSCKKEDPQPNQPQIEEFTRYEGDDWNWVWE